MLMFENGLLASFIPEFLMVLAYLFCLFVPGLKTEKQLTDCTPKIIHTSIVQSTVVSVYKVTQLDFSTDNHVVESENQLSVFPIFDKLTAFINLIVFPLDGLFQVHFTRPPPMI